MATVTLELTDDERGALDELRQMGAFFTDEDTLRCGLQHLARHLELRLGRDVFVERGPRRKAKAS